MAVRASGAACSISYRLSRTSFLFPQSDCTPIRAHSFSLPIRWPSNFELRSARKTKTLVHFVEIEDGSFTGTQIEGNEVMVSKISAVPRNIAREKSEWFTDLVAALVCSFGFSSVGFVAIYCRFWLQLEGEEVTFSEVFASFAVSVATAVGMEFWSKWVHKELWHNSLWKIHKSHHIPRKGQFELNDIFAVLNAVPAIALLSYGTFHIGLLPGLCFGAGLGVTVLGMAYVCVHDGFIHKRFPVGPIANVPYLKRVAVAHQLHHSNKFRGVPYGFFLGPKELQDTRGLEGSDR